ncbi:SPT3 Dosage dependent suppressor of Ty-induced promoter mutations-like protein, partial [Lunasporangiospora selenospora]
IVCDHIADSKQPASTLPLPGWNSSIQTQSFSDPNSASPLRLNVRTNVFKKELQEYVPVQEGERLRIETIIYAELSLVDSTAAEGSVVKGYDFVRLPKELFYTAPDKLISNEDLATKKILDVSTSLMCPSNNWEVEKETCVRCARRMSSKLDEAESRIIHMLPELLRTEDGDALINFRSGVASLQFKVNCYCGHKKEKKGFVIQFDAQSSSSPTIASFMTTPMMFYHENKNRIAIRAAKAQAKAELQLQRQQQQQQQELQRQQQKQMKIDARSQSNVSSASSARNIVKSVNSRTKRELRTSHRDYGPLQSHSQHQSLQPLQPLQQQVHIPSPPDSSYSSPIDFTPSSDVAEYTGSPDVSMTPSGLSQDPMGSLFPDYARQSMAISAPSPNHDQLLSEEQSASNVAVIGHMTPSNGTTRGGTMVTIHGSGFTVGEMMYIFFGNSEPVRVVPNHGHVIECRTPATTKPEAVSVIATSSPGLSSIPEVVETPPATFTYIDDNEVELYKLALQRVMDISGKDETTMDSVLARPNDLAIWQDLLSSSSTAEGSSLSSSVSSSLPSSSLSLPSVSPVSPVSPASSSSSPPTAVAAPTYEELEAMVLESFKLVDTSSPPSPLAPSPLTLQATTSSPPVSSPPSSPSLNNALLSIVNSTGHSMLHLSVALQYLNLAKELLMRGVDPGIKDKNGLTALDLARVFKHGRMIDFLMNDIESSSAYANEQEYQQQSSSSFFNDAASALLKSASHQDMQTLQNQLGMGHSQYPLVPDVQYRQQTMNNASQGGLRHSTSYDDPMSLAWINNFSQMRPSEMAYHKDMAIPDRLQGESLPPPRIQPTGRTDVNVPSAFSRVGNMTSSTDVRQQQSSQYQAAIQATGRLFDEPYDPARSADAAAAGSRGGRVSHPRYDSYGSSGSSGSSGESGAEEDEDMDLFEGHHRTVEQAVVQSSRNDVESEPSLYLGGRRVVFERHDSHRQASRSAATMTTNSFQLEDYPHSGSYPPQDPSNNQGQGQNGYERH